MMTANLNWKQMHWQRPLPPDRAVGVLRQLAADPRSQQVVLETRASASGIANLLGGAAGPVAYVAALITDALPGTTLHAPAIQRQPAQTARRLKASTRHRALRVDDPQFAVRALASALSRVRAREELVVQVVLGPRRVPLAIPTNSPSSIVSPWWHIALHGNGKIVDSEKRAALRTKVGDHGFACTIRLGVIAPTSARRHSLILGVLAALRTGESAGLQLRLIPEQAQRLDQADAPWRWPLRLNVAELVGLLGWPLGDDDLPGFAAVHPRRLPPAPGTTAKAAAAARVVARSPLAGHAPLVLRPADALHHLHVLGPTGTGKSTLLAGLITQDIAAGRAVIVIEPKGDLVADVLSRVPENRQDDVVVLDPADSAPVGLNPLFGAGAPELRADSVLAVFRSLYGSAIGPRSADILHAGLLTLAQRPDASLVMLPLLLTDAGFRRSLTAQIRDPIGLGPFWASYESWSEGERQAAIAPVMNKLRPLLRTGVRGVLGQREPRFDLRQVFTERKILLVPLNQASVGPEAAALIGSLVVAQLWQTVLSRSSIAPTRRHPVMVYIDEVQDFLHLPTDIADALAQARGLGVGFTLAHQYLNQLNPELRAGVLSNARSRVCFQLAANDAGEVTKAHPEIDAADLTALGQYEVYASLYARGQVTPFASGVTTPLPPTTADARAIRAASRMRYGQPLDQIEAGFAELLTASGSGLGPTGRRRRTS